MTIAILGTGAIARYYAYRLQSVRPLVVGRTLSPFTVWDNGKDYAVAPHHMPWDMPVGFPLDVVLVAVKWPGIHNAAEWIKTHAPSALVFSLMNGMGQEDYLSSPHATFVPTVTTTAVTRHDSPPGITVAAQGDTWTASTNHPAESDWKHLVRTLALPWDWLSPIDLEALRWQKLIQNSIINPLSVLANCANGELPQRPIWALAPQLWQEALPVAAQEGFVLTTSFEETIYTLTQTTAHNRSSMLQDVLAHKPTEINAITGFLTQKAIQHDIAVPTHHQILHKIHAITSSFANKTSE